MVRSSATTTTSSGASSDIDGKSDYQGNPPPQPVPTSSSGGSPTSPDTDSPESESEPPPTSPEPDSPVASQHDAYSSDSEPATGYETDSSICPLSDALTSDSEPASDSPVASQHYAHSSDAHTIASETPTGSPETDSPVASQHDAHTSESEPPPASPETDSSICSLSEALTSDSEPASGSPENDSPVASLSGGDSEAGDDAGAEKAIAWLKEAKLLKPLYEGSAITLAESILNMSYFMIKGGNSRKGVDQFCKFKASRELPRPNLSPPSYFCLMKYLGVNLNDASDRRGEYHCCPNGCLHHFPYLERRKWEAHFATCPSCNMCVCTHCNGMRFNKEEGGMVRPASYGFYLGVGRAIDQLDLDDMYRAFFESFDRREPQSSQFELPGLLRSVLMADMDVELKKQHPMSSVYSTTTRLFKLGIDWEDAFKRESWSSGVLLLRPMDISTDVASRARFTKLVQIICGPKQPQHMGGHLMLLGEELSKIFKVGYQTPREKKQGLEPKPCVWSSLDADIPALHKMLGVASHAAYGWCNRCSFIGNRLNNVLRLVGYSEPQSQVLKSDREKAKKRRRETAEVEDIEPVVEDLQVTKIAKAKKSKKPVADESTYRRQEEHFTSENKKFAWEIEPYTNATLREEALVGGPDAHIGSDNVLLRDCQWFDIVNGVNIPIAHTLCHGVLDSFLAEIFRPYGRTTNIGHIVQNKHRTLLDTRMRHIVTVANVSRPPKKLSKNRGFWTYDDSAWAFCVYISL